MNKNVRVSYRRKNNNMGAIKDIRAQMDKMSAILEQLLENKKSQGQTDNGADPVAGVPIDDSAVLELYKGFTKYLQDEGFISKKPLNQRGAAPTPDETPASVNGPVTVLYGLRKLKEKITDANFVIENLPAFSAVAANGVQGEQVAANTPSNSWSAAHASNIRTQYEKLAEVIKELKSLMASPTLNI